MVTMRVYGRLFTLAAAVITIVLAAQPSRSQTATPCNETIAKYCMDVIPGGGRIMKCLNDHRDDQSSACKDWLEEQNKSLKELNAVCTEEIAVLCNANSANSASIFICLDGNYVALKSACRDKLREIKDRMQ
jgi:hypothetical protein